jgi:hypothetical protein
MNSLKLFWKILNWKHGILAIVITMLSGYSFAYIKYNHYSYWYMFLVFFPLLWLLWMVGCYLLTNDKYKKYWGIK